MPIGACAVHTITHGGNILHGIVQIGLGKADGVKQVGYRHIGVHGGQRIGEHRLVVLADVAVAAVQVVAGGHVAGNVGVAAVVRPGVHVAAVVGAIVHTVVGGVVCVVVRLVVVSAAGRRQHEHQRAGKQQSDPFSVHFTFLLILVSQVVCPKKNAKYLSNQGVFFSKQSASFCSAFFSMRET